MNMNIPNSFVIKKIDEIGLRTNHGRATTTEKATT